MDFIWIFFAFVCGLAAKTVHLPPSIGFLIAGFALNYLGYQADDSLTTLSHLGITLMLFTIGLKLNVKSLFKSEVWLTSSLHTILWLIFTIIIIKLFAIFAIGYFTEVDSTTAILIAFALSFSSTVCVIKLLEENGEMRTRHGKLAVGILVIQDIVAVAFLVFATGETPSIWAFSLLALFLVKPLISKVIVKVGHGELIPLAGFFIALGSYELFELVNIKGDLGALLIGMYLSTHPKASEINKSLLSFKDLFLIGFFLSIGFTALPTIDMIPPLIAISAVLIVKGMLLFHILAALRVPGRGMFLGSMLLTNYSEFGLIVTALCVINGWLEKEWLVIIALGVSLSFIFTSIFYAHAHTVYARMRVWVKHFERKQPTPSYQEQLKKADILVIGMGRVGRSSYDHLHECLGDKVWGVESDIDKVKQHRSAGRHVILGDAEDADFWETRELWHIKLVMLAMPSIVDIHDITAQLKISGYKGHIAAIARYEDEREQLIKFGVDNVFNHYVEAGTGFAEESMLLIQNENNKDDKHTVTP